jgi:hypothetical protein
VTHQIALAEQKLGALKYCIYARKSMEAEDCQVLSAESSLNKMWAIVESKKLIAVEIKLKPRSVKESNSRPVF